MKPPTSPSPVLSYGVAVLAPAVALLAWWGLGRPAGLVFLFLLAAVAGGAGAGGRRAGVLALVLSLVAGGYLLVRPLAPVGARPPASAGWVGFLLLLLLGLAVSQMGEWLRQAGRPARGADRDVTPAPPWLRAALANVTEAVIATDTKERVVFLNPAASRLTGWAADDAVGRALPEVFQLISERTRTPMGSPSSRALYGGAKTPGPVEQGVLRARDGSERRAAGQAAAVRDERGQLLGAVVVFNEVRPAPEVVAAPRPVRAPEPEHPPDDLLALLARELHDPEGPLPRALDLLRRPGADERAVGEARDLLEHRFRDLTRRVDDLLDAVQLARGKASLQTQRVDLARLARTAAEEHRPSLEQAGRTLTVELPEAPVWVRGDPPRLARIVGALLEEEVTGTPRAGHVTVRISVDAPRLHAVLSVRDTALEVRPDALPRLFQAPTGSNNTHPPDGPGGMGLPLVRELVVLHGGEVQAAAGDGPGVEFVLRFPLEQEPEALSEMPAEPQAVPIRMRVLVIEDNRESADSLGLLLKLLGHDVTVAYSGPDGLRLAEQVRPQLVLCDLAMPQMDGYQVAEHLRRNPATAKARLIAISGRGDEEDRQRSHEAGFDAHLVKPVDPKVLENVIAFETLVRPGE